MNYRNDGYEEYRARSGGFGADEGIREAPTGELVKELFSNAQVLLREEVRLAKLEVRSEAKKAAKAGGLFAGGGVLLHTSLLLFAGFLVAALWGAMPLWASALIVFVLFAGAGAAAVFFGKKRLELVEPERTVRSLKEDKEWAKDTMQSVRSHRHGNA